MFSKSAQVPRAYFLTFMSLHLGNGKGGGEEGKEKQRGNLGHILRLC